MRATGKHLTFVALVLLLVAGLGLVGCGNGDEEARPEIRIGILQDFTGPASSAIRPVVAGTQHYFQRLEDLNLLPDVRVRLVTYDTRSDYGKAPVGYEWLKGQDCQILWVMSTYDCETLADRFVQDQIPNLGAQQSVQMLENEWCFYQHCPIAAETEAIMEWIISDWDYTGEGRSPKIGVISSPLGIAWATKDGIDESIENNPDKFNLIAYEEAAMGTTAWASQIEKVKDADYVFVGVVGAMMSSFVKEFRAKDYTAKLVTPPEFFPGFFDLVLKAVPNEDLYDCYTAMAIPWWTEDLPFINEMKQAMADYEQPENVAAWTGLSNYLEGWLAGMIFEEAIRNAIEEVGAENVDAVAMQAAMWELDMDIEGFPYRLKVAENEPYIYRMIKMYKYDQDAEGFMPMGDWILPPGISLVT